MSFSGGSPPTNPLMAITRLKAILSAATKLLCYVAHFDTLWNTNYLKVVKVSLPIFNLFNLFWHMWFCFPKTLQNFPKLCIGDVFVTYRVPFLTGPPPKRILQCLPPLDKKKKRNPSRIRVLEYSDSDIPIFVTELQFLLIGLPLPK